MATRKNTPARPNFAKARLGYLITELTEVHRSLESVYSIVAVTASVLENQSADRDIDIARCLVCGALRPLSKQVERVERLMRDFGHA